METTNTEARFETRPVLAGAYRANNPASLLTHLVDTQGTAPEGYEFKVVCGRAKHVCDAGGSTPAELAARPTCPKCAAKWDRIRKNRA